MDEFRQLIAGLKLHELADKAKILKTCRCHHTKNGDPNIAISEKSAPGQMLYTCKECKKEITLHKISEESMMEAISIIDSMCDIIKMMENSRGSTEEKMLNQVEEIQIAVNDWLPKLYNACFK